MTQEEAPQRLPTEEVRDFAEIEGEFSRRISRIVWCSVATVDSKGRPRSRLLHPIWEVGSGTPVGWIATGRHSFKERHLAANHHVSLGYWDAVHEQVYVDAAAQWVDDAGEKQRIWDLYKSTPPPLGYDPGMIWRRGVEDPGYGLLKLIPWRVELWGIADLMAQRPPKVWRP
jgi:general stress protein 26